MDMTSTLKNISDTALKVGMESYIKDGLKYCIACDTPMQTVIHYKGKRMTVNCLCRCLSDALAEEERKFEEQQKAERISRNRCGMRDISYRNMTFDKSDVELRRESNYCTLFPKMLEMNAGLMFLGGFGTGKTFRAAAIGNQLISNGYRVYMDCVTSLCNDITASRDRQAFVSDICSYDLLILDDVGAERDTPYMAEMMYNLIDSRYRAQKPLIVTTNLTIEEMKTAQNASKRTYDRLFEMCCYPITIVAESRRRGIGNAKYMMLKNLMEG